MMALRTRYFPQQGREGPFFALLVYNGIKQQTTGLTSPNFSDGAEEKWSEAVPSRLMKKNTPSYSTYLLRPRKQGLGNWHNVVLLCTLTLLMSTSSSSNFQRNVTGSDLTRVIPRRKIQCFVHFQMFLIFQCLIRTVDG